MRSRIPKTELQDTHSWHLKSVAQLFHFGSNRSQILGNEWKIAQRLPQSVKKVVLRSLSPASIDRSFFVRRNLPVRFESAEVIEADDVALLQGPFHSLKPPIVAVLTKDVPTIEWIPPELAGLAEEIGWNAGNEDWV